MSLLKPIQEVVLPWVKKEVFLGRDLGIAAAVYVSLNDDHDELLWGGEGDSLAHGGSKIRRLFKLKNGHPKAG